MKRLIDTLPGVSMSVGEVTRTFRHMWDPDASRQDHRMDFRASQMNLILHLGLETSEAEAGELFNTAIRFAQTYPCRIIVLCPARETGGEDAFEGKLFSQCYLGRHFRNLCCCEALILGYSPEDSDFLENQVSIWLESDLPIYHWLHRVPAERIERFYRGFLKRCRKVLYDGGVEGDAYDAIDWPSGSRIADFALARTLPLRQHIGQFISRFSPDELVDGLQSLRIRHSEETGRMAFQLLRWHQSALERCFHGREGFEDLSIGLDPLESGQGDCCLRVDWTYADPDRRLEVVYDRSRKAGRIRASLPSGNFEHALHIEPLSGEAVLGEALFFSET
jgi:hypothetical protein